MNTPNHAPHVQRAVLLMLGATLCFAALDATAKHLSQTYPVPMLVWSRYTFHCLLMLVVLGPSMRRKLVATSRPLANIVRAFMLVCVTACAMAGFRRLPLGESTAFLFINPLLVVLLSAWLLREKVSGGRWLAVLGGFGGALLIARPGGALDAEGLLWMGLAAVAYAVYQIQTRQLSPTENTLTMLFYTALVGTVVMTLAAPLYWGGPMPDAADAAIIATLGLFGGGGHLLLTRAFRDAPASLLSPLLYVQLVWATLLGGAVYGHWPDGASLAGMAIIAAASASLALRQSSRKE